LETAIQIILTPAYIGLLKKSFLPSYDDHYTVPPPHYTTMIHVWIQKKEKGWGRKELHYRNVVKDG
jgi:hypothetical protein